ncbi:MAG: VOC family protein [Leptospirales bacterium]|nr:VOC family protein [Leptospirales bacterium]
MNLPQRISFVTLGVARLDRSREFYSDALGWTPIKDTPEIIFYNLNGIFLGLFPSEELAADANVAASGEGFRHFTLAINLRSELEVDQAFARLRRQGAAIPQAPARVSWGGYRGYFADPDGHLWEIAFNPHIRMDESGNLLDHR